MTISEVARRTGLRPSAIRYYEELGILAPPQREGGQRRYGMSAVYQLAVLCRAQEAGFSLNEIRELFLGFPPSTPVSKRWTKLARQKHLELDEKIRQLQSMKDLLANMETRCACETVANCGAALLQSGHYGRTGNSPRRA